MKNQVLIPTLWVLLACCQMQVQARIYYITNTNDTTSVSSLRGAIIDANKHSGINTILLGPIAASHHRVSASVVLHLTLPGADEDAARSGDLDITQGRLSIIGPEAGLTIDTTGLGDRVFQVFQRANLTLQNINLVGGTAPGNEYGTLREGESGGAIWNSGSLSLINCIITRNSSGGGNAPQGNGGGTKGGDGGGIYNSGHLWLQNCWLVDNSAGAGLDGRSGGSGGGLHNEGICVLSRCVVEANQSGGGGGPAGNALGFSGNGGNGGGLYNSGNLTLLYCTISNNFAGQGASGGVATIVSVGFLPGGWGGSGGNGAGIYNDGTLNLLKSSVVNNSAGCGGTGGSGVGVDAAGRAGFGGAGGGIFNAHILSLTNCLVSGNAGGAGGAGGDCVNGDGADGGLGGSGGGIYTSGTFQAANSTISFNCTGTGGSGGDCQNYNYATNFPGNGNAGGAGAGIFNQGTAVLTASTICSNTCANGGDSGMNLNRGVITSEGGDGGSGGGICSLDHLQLINCTISGNLCGNSAGFWHNLAERDAGGSGGGIYNQGILQLTSCTITTNTFGIGSTFVSPGGTHMVVLYGSGGGLFNQTNAESVIVRNSIVAGNKPLILSPAPGGQMGTFYNFDVDVSGNFTSQGFNFVGTAADDSGFVNDTNADQVGSPTLLLNPLLGPLQMNGGSTPTHGLLPGSPAMDQGISFRYRTDQRGKPRPHNFTAVPNAAAGDGSDIGAFEL